MTLTMTLTLSLTMTPNLLSNIATLGITTQVITAQGKLTTWGPAYSAATSASGVKRLNSLINSPKRLGTSLRISANTKGMGLAGSAIE